MNAPLFKGAVCRCLLIFLGSLLFACSEQEADIYENHGNEIVPELQSEVFELINAHRVSIQLPPFNFLDVAYIKAREHTAYMVDRREPNHDYFYDREAYLVSFAGAQEVAENVAYAYSTAEGVVSAWLASSAHRGIIEGDFTHASICAMKGDDGRLYYTHIFVKK